MRQILQAVADCHVHGIIHRDLKPENFLYVDSTENSLLKLTDFGLSEFFSLQSNKPFSDIAGSAFYVAPEVLRRKYGPSADLWSCGVIMYILVTGEVCSRGPQMHQVNGCVGKFLWWRLFAFCDICTLCEH
jgi:serine/threonine protein kinase